MDIEVITCTGFRPEAFELCTEWVTRQTRKPDTWTVYDDKYRPLEVEDVPTFTRNMALALQKATGDILVFMEDDDFYAPVYLEAIENEFKHSASEMVGLTEVTYYNVQFAKWRSLYNHTYCPMAFTAIRREMAPVLLQCLGTPNHTADVAFWHLCREQEVKMTKIPAMGLGIGVKGMPGRPGIGIGHRDLDMRWKSDDTEKSKARDLFGVDFHFYEPFILRT